jgi:hypothetical protein
VPIQSATRLDREAMFNAKVFVFLTSQPGEGGLFVPPPSFMRLSVRIEAVTYRAVELTKNSRNFLKSIGFVKW